MTELLMNVLTPFLLSLTVAINIKAPQEMERKVFEDKLDKLQKKPHYLQQKFQKE
jgi:hypothetical protein